jgi:hypothetical protein
MPTKTKQPSPMEERRKKYRRHSRQGNQEEKGMKGKGRG